MIYLSVLASHSNVYKRLKLAVHSIIIFSTYSLDKTKAILVHAVVMEFYTLEVCGMHCGSNMVTFCSTSFLWIILKKNMNLDLDRCSLQHGILLFIYHEAISMCC